MNYKVVFTEKAQKDIKKLDKSTVAIIMGWIRKNLENCKNPKQHGKGLTANRGGQWRYRIGDYRIIAHISEETVTILVLQVAHRSEVYKS